MPLDFQILSRFGTTNGRLREIFTAKAPEKARPGAGRNESKEDKKTRLEYERKVRQDIGYRQMMERRIRTRVDEGVMRSLKNYHFFAAADLAWDSSVITKATIPLLMYAQGKLNIERAATAIEGVKGADKCIRKDVKGKAIGIDLPKFLECNVNLIRSFVTRRLSAQANIFGNLYPFYKYESRTTGLVGKCRADVLSQRVDVMADQFDHRHHDVQCMRDGFLYAHCVDFQRAAWEVEKQWVKKDVDDGMENTEPPADNSDLESEIVKEGIAFVNPHPSRVYWDNAYPLSSINTDSGCQFIGYWDVVRYRDVMDNPDFYNCDSIGWSTKFWGIGGAFLNYKAFFDQYLGTITPPSMPKGMGLDPAGENDRQSNIGVYSVDLHDASLLLTNHFEKIVPKDWGIGDYPFPVWIRFIVASDATVVYAEIYPSTPAAYLGINEDDNKQLNLSVAHELMAYQDQLTNLFNQMLMIVEGELFKAIGINIDCLTAEQIKLIRDKLKGDDWSTEPIVYEFSLAKLKELGIEPDKVVTVTETRIGQSLTSVFEAMAKLIAMAEKLMAMSPAEQGQPAPREISATEVTEIASTTSSIYSFITQSVNEYRSAKKRIIYESLVCCSEGQLKCPVMDRYTKDTIKKAGFEAVDGMEEGFVSSLNIDRHTVIGSRRKLVHDYIFTSRDGEERAVKTQAANTLVQLVAQCLQVPAVLSAMGKEKIYEIFNEIFRLSGAGVDLNLELKPGEDNSLGPDQVKQLQGVVDQMQKSMQQIANAVQNDTQQIQQQKQVNADVQKHFEALVPIAKQVEQIVSKGAHESISINYKDAPPSIQRQMEKSAGFDPAPDAERVPAG